MTPPRIGWTRRLTAALTFGTIVLVGCTPGAPGPGATTTTTTSTVVAPGERSVSVIGGAGSGAYRPGTTVHVWSSVSTLEGVAQRWSGDQELLAEPDEWHTTFVMPDRDVRLVANSTNGTRRS